MAAFFRFLAGVLIGTIYIVGSAAAGYILFEQFGFIAPLVAAAIVVLLLLDITAFTSFPRAITNGLLVPQIAVLMGLGFFYAKEELALYFTDDVAYRSCVGNFDNKQGAADCSILLMKLETKGHIVLKEIEDTKGDYWLAEILSYRGRHYIRDKQIEKGKADFARALLIPDGVAVTVNNLAEAGFTRSDIFQPDYDALLEDMSANARCLSAASKLGKQSDAARYSKAISTKNQEAIKLCRLSTGREESDCDKIIDSRVRSIISLSNRFYVEATDDELAADLKLCQP
jgi:hypothetical protein